MKTHVSSSRKALLQAFYGFVIAGAALLALSRDACAQLYVTNMPQGGGAVSEYNAETGAVINLNFITTLDVPGGLALLGNRLFVTNYGSGTVGEYDATTGAAIKAHLITGLEKPVGIAINNPK